MQCRYHRPVVITGHNPAHAPQLDSPLGADRTSLADQVISQVRERIGTGELVPGELYSVYQLSERLQVSRSPVREGLLRLAEAGMIVFERNRGFRVVLPGPRDIAEIFALRIEIEVPAARRVALQSARETVLAMTVEDSAMRTAAHDGDEVAFSHHDRAFHDAILRHASNERARHIVAGLREVTRLIGASTTQGGRSLTTIHAEHAPILRAVEAGDGDGAQSAMRDHLERTGRLLVAQGIEAMRRTAQHDGERDAERLWKETVG